MYHTFNHSSILKLIMVVTNTRRESPPETTGISKHRCLLGPHAFLGTLFSYTRIQCPSFRMQTQISHPYKTAINTVSYVLMTNKMHNSYNQFYNPFFCLLYMFRTNLVTHHEEHGIIYCITQYIMQCF